MKTFFIILFTSIFSMTIQNIDPEYDFNAAWKRVAELARDGYNSDLSELLDEIKGQATKNENGIEAFNAFAYKMDKTIINTDSIWILINTEIEESKLLDYKSLLYAYKGSIAKNAKNNNNGRGATDVVDQKDASLPSEMSPILLREIAYESFFVALENQNLKKIPLSAFRLDYLGLGLQMNDINGIEDENTAFYKSLNAYDVVAKEFFNFLESDQGVESLTGSEFTVEDFMCEKSTFLNKKFSSDQKALKVEKVGNIFQSILSQKRDQEINGFYLDKIRYEYYRNVFVDETANQLYKAFLLKYEKSKDIDIALISSLELLSMDMGNEDKYDSIYQKSILLRNKYSSSKFVSKIDDLQSVIKYPSFNGNIKKVFGSSEKVTLKLTSRNLSSIKYKVYKVSSGALMPYILSYDKDGYGELVKSGKLVKSVDYKLNKSGYKTLNSKIDIGKMPNGSYLVEIYNEDQVSKFVLFQVSDLVVSYMNVKNVMVNDRKSGKAIVKAKVESFVRNYRNRNIDKSSSSMITNADGKVIVGGQGGYALVVSYKKDTIITIDDQINIYNTGYASAAYTNVIAYTDRAIYRPGQTVYYKFIANSIDKDQRSILANFNIPVTINDANGELVVSNKNARTNSFGSFTGSFVIPKGKLNGYYSINTPFGGQSVKVEEYKRPSFEILKESRTKAETRKEISTLKIKAVGLAGNAITDALVKYRVERKVSTPRCFWWFPQNDEVQNITIGTGKTDEKGFYELTFSDKEEILPRPVNKSIIYTVYFDVTDQAGETQNFSESFSFGSQTMYLLIQSEDQYDVNDNQNIMVNAYNNDMDTIKVPIVLKVYQTKQPKSYLEIEEVSDEGDFGPINSNSSRTDVKDMVLIKTLQSQSSEQLDLKLNEGSYLLVASSSKDTTAFFEKSIHITNFKNKKFPISELFFFKTNVKLAYPGQKLKLDIGSSEKIYTRVVIKRGEEMIKDELIKVARTNTIEYTIDEKDRGGLRILLYSVFNNTFKISNIDIDVPWDNKELDLKIESIRNKILPGAKEEITLKILYKGKPIESEIMATLYDASLEMLAQHSWTKDFYYKRYGYIDLRILENGRRDLQGTYEDYAQFNLSYPSIPDVFPSQRYGRYYKSMMSDHAMAPTAREADGGALNEASNAAPAPEQAKKESGLQEVVPANQVRENLNELVFFYPQLQPDKDGKIKIEYTMNDALTRWKLMVFAHDKEMRIGYVEDLIVTQKPLMIKPNKPRILRFGDKLFITANVSNLSDGDMSNVLCSIDLRDFGADSTLMWTTQKSSNINLKKGETKAVSWPISVPETTDVSLLEYTMSVSTKNAQDAEKDIIPIVTNKILITEAVPFNTRGLEEKVIKFALPTLQDGKIEKVAVEYTSDPAWTAFVALPSMQPAKVESAGELINRIFADKTGMKIIQDAPQFKKALEMQLASGNKFQSKLQQNEELKYLLLESTPYVGMVNAEVLNYNGLYKFLNINNVNNEIAADIKALETLQNTDGGFSWQKNDRSSTYITQNVLQLISQLQRNGCNTDDLNVIAKKAAAFVLKELEYTYSEMKRKGQETNYTTGGELHTISILSAFMEKENLIKNEAFKFFYDKHMLNWNKVGIYDKPTLGLLAMDFANQTVSEKIMKYFDQNKKTSSEMGTYWEDRSGFDFYQMPISLQADIIELYLRNKRPSQEIDEMKIWLIKSKQVNSWPTTSQTSHAIYALLLKGSPKEVEMNHQIPNLLLNGKNIVENSSYDNIGYFKTYPGLDLLKPGINDLKVKNNANHIAYGGAYLQYWEKADKVAKSPTNPLTIKKSLYKEVDGKNGKELIAIKAGEEIHPGDVLTSRIVIVSDRDMDFVSLTDYRPSGFEPVRNQNSYGFWRYPSYSQDITDYQANYFFNHLAKGTKVIENKIIAVHKGEFSGGIATIQSQYSADFTSHSEGVRIMVN